MRLRQFLFPVGVVAVLAIGLAARADVKATVFNGQSIEGLVFKDEDVRLVLPMAAGATGKLKFTVSGWRATVSFIHQGEGSGLFDPDNQLVAEGEDLVYGPSTPSLRKRSTTFRIDKFTARKTGNYTLVLRTNTIATLRAKGKWKVSRPKFERFEGDETSGPFPLPLQQGDSVRIRVNTGDGDPPRVANFVLPSGARFPPPQKFNKKGTKTTELQATTTGEFGFEVGYQIPGVAGSYKGKVFYSVVKGLGTAQLRRTNPPGVLLSVLPSERALDVTFGDQGVGIASPAARTLTITSERNGELLAKSYTDTLAPVDPFGAAVAVLTQSDVQPTRTFAGHRLLYLNGSHWATYSTTSDTDFGVLKFNDALQTTATREVLVNSPSSTQEPFLVQNRAGDGIFVGLLAPSAGHTVYGFDANLATVSTQTIGVGGLAHRNGGAAQWNPVTALFELWAPDSLVPGQPSDLHRQYYTQVWAATGVDNKPVNDAALQETMSTALSVDTVTGASILHYVVVRNTNTGAGEIHRRVFDSDGTEYPESHVVLTDGTGSPFTDRTRPISTILGNFLYLGFDTSTGPRVEQYPILR